MTDAQAAVWAALPGFAAATAAHVAAKINRDVADVRADLDALVTAGQLQRRHGKYAKVRLDRRAKPR